jgi:inorganic pyrophosphatase/exopolyphosphatase
MVLGERLVMAGLGLELGKIIKQQDEKIRLINLAYVIARDSLSTIDEILSRGDRLTKYEIRAICKKTWKEHPMSKTNRNIASIITRHVISGIQSQGEVLYVR